MNSDTIIAEEGAPVADDNQFPEIPASLVSPRQFQAD
jgi:hypothetical protein